MRLNWALKNFYIVLIFWLIGCSTFIPIEVNNLGSNSTIGSENNLPNNTDNTFSQVESVYDTGHSTKTITPIATTEKTKISENQTILYTPTSDIRLLPEDWKSWPVVPVLSETARNIYQKGLQMGNDQAAFSKVGDCQSIKQVLLGIFDRPDRYKLSDDKQFLQETIDLYGGSFDRDGMAVKGGFNAAAVLSPIWADPEYCLAGELPIECEYRIHKPSIVIISLEVWWEGRTVDRYDAYMRRIIEFFIDHGVLPILSTKADNVEGDHSINLATAKLAYEYDIPLWNFWLAVQTLPNQGIDPLRDGFHITTAAWNVRSFSALETLDSVRRSASDSPVIKVVNITATPENIKNQIDIPITNTLETIKIDDDDTVTGKVIFGIKEKDEQIINNIGIWMIDFDNNQFIQIVESGFNLQAVSLNKQKIIINRETKLYSAEFNGSNKMIIADNFFPYGEKSVYETSDGSIIFIGTSNDETFVFQLNDDGTRDTLTAPGDWPIRLFPSSDRSKIYWIKGKCNINFVCTDQGVWSTKIDTYHRSEELVGINNPVFNTDGTWYSYQKEVSYQGLNITSYDRDIDQYIELPGNNLIDYSWANNSDQLISLTVMRSNYSGKSSNVRIFKINTINWLIQEYYPITGLNARIVWSPDDHYLLTTSTIQNQKGKYEIKIVVICLNNKKTYEITKEIKMISPNFLTTSNIYWVNVLPNDKEQR